MEPKVYTKNYCEENVYRRIAQRLGCLDYIDSHDDRDFVDKIPEDEINKFTAIFISNASRKIPFFYQKGGKPYVVWDYHVILMEQVDDEFIIWDYDSDLPTPFNFQQYFEHSLNDCNRYTIPDELKRMFRFVPAKHYLKKFNSDRSHMKVTNGEWMSPPPQWPAIFENSSELGIDDFISMHHARLSEISFVVTEDEIFSKDNMQKRLHELIK